MKRKIYIGCSLTHSPQEFKDLVTKLKGELSSEYEILEFLGLEKGTPADVYKADILQGITRSDFLVALCDYPSIGLGYEMATALEKYSKPTLGLAHVDAKVTRFVEGIDHPMYTFKRYTFIEEIISSIKEKELKHFKPIAPVEVCETDVCAV